MPTVAPVQVVTKKRCCKSGPRCKRCPVVLKRLELLGLAEAAGKRRFELSDELSKKDWKLARAKPRG